LNQSTTSANVNFYLNSAKQTNTTVILTNNQTETVRNDTNQSIKAQRRLVHKHTVLTLNLKLKYIIT